MEEGESSGLRVLLVGDEEEILNLSRTHLSRETDRMELEVCSSPKEALERLRAGNFDLVVSGCRMPEMDGIELLKEIRENGWSIPFLLSTGKGNPDVARKALNRVASEYIEKKGDPIQQLRDLSEKILRREDAPPARFSKNRELTAPVGEDVSDNELSGFVNVADYDSFVDRAVGIIGGEEGGLRVVLTFADQKILRSFLEMDKGSDLQILIPEKTLQGVKEVSDYLLRKEVDELSDLLEKSAKVCGRFPFSFFLKGGQSLLVEKNNPLYPTEFFHGFFFRDERVYDRFLNLFEDIYQNASKRRMTL